MRHGRADRVLEFVRRLAARREDAREIRRAAHRAGRGEKSARARGTDGGEEARLGRGRGAHGIPRAPDPGRQLFLRARGGVHRREARVNQPTVGGNVVSYRGFPDGRRRDPVSSHRELNVAQADHVRRGHDA